jgi:hypothetical protein
MLNDRENILSALRGKALKVREIMKRANVANEEVAKSLLLKMRDEGVGKFDIHSGFARLTTIAATLPSPLNSAVVSLGRLQRPEQLRVSAIQ